MIQLMEEWGRPYHAINQIYAASIGLHERSPKIKNDCDPRLIPRHYGIYRDKGVEYMNIFRDYYNNEVKLSFSDHPFSKNPKHVWVICQFKNDWLLTKHKDRGFEFPGGKVERDETAEQAANREVMEETGGTIEKLTYIGQYIVSGKADTVIKNVYYARIRDILPQDTYFETAGPVMLPEIPKDVKSNALYSFIMKDGVLPHCLGYLARHNMLMDE